MNTAIVRRQELREQARRATCRDLSAYGAGLAVLRREVASATMALADLQSFSGLQGIVDDEQLKLAIAALDRAADRLTAARDHLFRHETVVAEADLWGDER